MAAEDGNIDSDGSSYQDNFDSSFFGNNMSNSYGEKPSQWKNLYTMQEDE